MKQPTERRVRARGKDEELDELDLRRRHHLVHRVRRVVARDGGVPRVHHARARCRHVACIFDVRVQLRNRLRGAQVWMP